MGFVVLDIETTGFDVKQDEILQLSIIDEKGNELFNEYFKPRQKETWEEAERVNRISPLMVADKPFFSERVMDVQMIIDKADVIVGYGVNFDVNFLNWHGVKFSDKRIVDVMEMFAKYYGEWDAYRECWKWKKLIFASEYFGYEWDGEAHNSLADVRATLFVYEKLLNPKVFELWYEFRDLDGNVARRFDYVRGDSKVEGWAGLLGEFKKLESPENYVIVNNNGTVVYEGKRLLNAK